MRAIVGAVVIGLLAMGSARAADDIVQLTQDTYMITRISRAGIFASMANLKNGVIRDANAFAASKGKVAVPLTTKETPVGGPGQWPMFEYQFRIVSPDSSEAQQSGVLVPRADVVIESNQNVTRESPTKADPSQHRDTYTELLKLDDLRKKGIISDAEFESEKRKILTGNQ